MRQCRTRHAHGTAQIHLQHLLPGFIRKPVNFSTPVHPGIVDHDINTAVSVDYLLNGGSHRVTIPDIALPARGRLT